MGSGTIYALTDIKQQMLLTIRQQTQPPNRDTASGHSGTNTPWLCATSYNAVQPSRGISTSLLCCSTMCACSLRDFWHLWAHTHTLFAPLSPCRSAVTGSCQKVVECGSMPPPDSNPPPTNSNGKRCRQPTHERASASARVHAGANLLQSFNTSVAGIHHTAQHSTGRHSCAHQELLPRVPFSLMS